VSKHADTRSWTGNLLELLNLAVVAGFCCLHLLVLQIHGFASCFQHVLVLELEGVQLRLRARQCGADSFHLLLGGHVCGLALG
jgi:hypothetical protein